MARGVAGSGPAPASGAARAVRAFRLPLVVAALGAVAAVGAAAEDRPVIVVGQGMAGVRPGMSIADVADVLGRATSTRNGRDGYGSTTDRYYAGPRLHVVLRPGADGREVSQMYTTARRLRTPAGLRVGSSEKAVRAALADVVCGRVPGRGGRACQLGRALPGRTVTSFQLNARRRVTRVAIGVILDRAAGTGLPT